MPTENYSPEATAVACAVEKSDAGGSETPAERSEGDGETPEEREARIGALREQIAQGTYKPDTQKLAAKLVDTHLKDEK